MAIKYKDETYIGPYNIFLKQRTRKKGSRWYGIFICPECHKYFETAIEYIVKGQTRSCGCLGGIKNLSGQHFGKLTALYPIDKRESGHIVWHCVCDCGNFKDVSTNHLQDGSCQSCGCLISENLIGKQYGKLTVLQEYTGEREHAGTSKEWLCQCECGGTIVATTARLKNGQIKSCGCLKSYGEKIIADFLNKRQILYHREYIFADCINPDTKKYLRFDFYIPDYNLCIEYNGSQHYLESEKHWGQQEFFTKEKVLLIQKRDNIKKEYCDSHNIHLLVIPFWEQNNVCDKLTQIFNELKGGMI